MAASWCELWNALAALTYKKRQADLSNGSSGIGRRSGRRRRRRRRRRVKEENNARRKCQAIMLKRYLV